MRSPSTSGVEAIAPENVGGSGRTKRQARSRRVTVPLPIADPTARRVPARSPLGSDQLGAAPSPVRLLASAAGAKTVTARTSASRTIAVSLSGEFLEGLRDRNPDPAPEDLGPRPAGGPWHRAGEMEAVVEELLTAVRKRLCLPTGELEPAPAPCAVDHLHEEGRIRVRMDARREDDPSLRERHPHVRRDLRRG